MGELIYGSSTGPKYHRRTHVQTDTHQDVDSTFNGCDPKKASKEYKQLAGALKGKERTEVMVQRYGGKAWDNFEAKLALRMLGQD